MFVLLVLLEISEGTISSASVVVLTNLQHCTHLQKWVELCGPSSAERLMGLSYRGHPPSLAPAPPWLVTLC